MNDIKIMKNILLVSHHGQTLDNFVMGKTSRCIIFCSFPTLLSYAKVAVLLKSTADAEDIIIAKSRIPES